MTIHFIMSLPPCLFLSFYTHAHTHSHRQPIIAFCSGSVQWVKASSHTLILGSKRSTVSASAKLPVNGPHAVSTVCHPQEITKPPLLLLRTIIEFLHSNRVSSNNYTKMSTWKIQHCQQIFNVILKSVAGLIMHLWWWIATAENWGQSSACVYGSGYLVG